MARFPRTALAAAAAGVLAVSFGGGMLIAGASGDGASSPVAVTTGLPDAPRPAPLNSTEFAITPVPAPGSIADLRPAPVVVTPTTSPGGGGNPRVPTVTQPPQGPQGPDIGGGGIITVID